MFGLGPGEVSLLLVCLLGVASPLVGRMSGVMSLRESSLALVVALALPVIGSMAALAMLVHGWRRQRTGTTVPAA